VTGISNLNVVVQQGGAAQDVHHIKQQTTEHTQMVTAQQEAIREADLKGKVPESEAADKLRLRKDKSKEKNDREQSEEEKKKKKEEEKKMTLTGKLLDTVA
jgi:hypothetical protein